MPLWKNHTSHCRFTSWPVQSSGCSSGFRWLVRRTEKDPLNILQSRTRRCYLSSYKYRPVPFVIGCSFCWEMTTAMKKKWCCRRNDCLQAWGSTAKAWLDDSSRAPNINRGEKRHVYIHLGISCRSWNFNLLLKANWGSKISLRWHFLLIRWTSYCLCCLQTALWTG